MKRNQTFRTFCRYISCNVLGMIGLSCYILADTYFVARAMGSNGLAALNFAIPAYTALTAAGLLLGVGGATRATILRSRKCDTDASAVFPNILGAGLVLSLAFAAVGIFGAPTVSRLLGANGETLPLTIPYLRILMLYAPAFLTNQILLAFVRNDSNPQLAMISMLAGSFTNIILDYVFMFPLNMGMVGAAVATGFSPVVGLCVLSLHFFRKNRTLRFIRCSIRPKEIFRSIQLGISAWLTEISSGIVLTVFNLVILRISGNTGVAAYGIVANIALVETAIYNGIAQGLQPLVSRAHGAGEQHTLKQYRRDALILACIVAALLYAAVFAWSDPLIALFNTEGNAALIPYARDGLRLYFPGFFFGGINIIFAAYLSASERPTDGFWISMTRGCLAILPLVLLLSWYFGMAGVWLAFPCCEAVTLGLTTFFLFHRKRKSI